MRLGTSFAACALVLTGLAATGSSVAASAPEVGVALPAGPADSVANGVAYVGDTVFASFRPAASPSADGVVYRTPADGSGVWVPVTAPGSDVPLTVPTDGLVSRGDALLLPAPVDDPATPCKDYRLITPIVDRAIESCGAAPVLGHGGRLVLVRTQDPLWLVTRPSDGHSFLAYPGDHRPAVEGTWAWRIGSTDLVGDDVFSAALERTPLPVQCSTADVADVMSRFAILDCQVGRVLVDLTGALTPRLLPAGAWRLGDGFVFDDHASDPNVPTHRVVRVMDLSRAQVTHVYGWSSSNASDNAVGRAEADDEGGQSLAMLTEAGQVERIELTWLGATASSADDTATPVIDTTSGSPAVITPTSLDPWRTTPVTFAWSGHDPGDSSALYYDVRLHSSGGPADPYWTYPQQWAGTFANSVEYGARVDETVCFEVRARDWVGNLSTGPDGGWSAPRCTRVPSGPPEVESSGFRPFVDRLGTVPVTFRYTGYDDRGVVSYDVAYRTAGFTEPFTDWVSPASWQRTSSMAVTKSVGPGVEVCFRVRGRDQGDNVSAYSAPRCTSVPYDDRAFKVHDGARRVRVERALGRTATMMWAGHGSMTRRGVHATQIWIRALGYRNDVCHRVLLGRRHARGGCFLYSVPGAVWQVYHFPAGSHGKLSISSGGRLVDAVAVVR